MGLSRSGEGKAVHWWGRTPTEPHDNYVPLSYSLDRHERGQGGLHAADTDPASPHPALLSVSLSITLSLAPATQKFFSRWEDWQLAPLPCVIKYLTAKICSDSLACTQPSGLQRGTT